MERDNETIVQLKEQIETESRRYGAATLQALDALRREARARKDDALLGFVYYYYAERFYFQDPDFPKFHRYLKLSIRHLLNADGGALLGNAYNLVAIDAHNSGNYTIAYQYYLAARSLAQDNRNTTQYAGSCANIARLMTGLGYYDMAEDYFGESVKAMDAYAGNPRYLRSMLTIHYLRGINYLLMKKKRKAAQCLARIQLLLETENGVTDNSLRLTCKLLEVMLLVAEGDTDSLSSALREVLALLQKEPALHDYTEDIGYLCDPLIEGGYLREAKRILDACGPRILSCEIAHVKRLFYELKLKLDQAAGNQQRIYADLRQLNNLFAELHDSQNERSLSTIELSEMMADLRARQKRDLRENEILNRQADTDALTGLPNRYAMNDALEETFDRAKKAKTPLMIAILDVDYFKEYNDTYGHQAGDVCLNALAGSLRKLAANKGVFCARYGGDEFIVIAEETDRKGAEKIAAYLREEIAACRILHKKSRSSSIVTVSQGYCIAVPGARDRIWDFLSEADQALYDVKKARGTSGARDASFRTHMR